MTIKDLVSSLPKGNFKEWVKKRIVFLFCVLRRKGLHDDAIFSVLNTFGYLRDLLNPDMVLSLNIEIPLLPHCERHIKEGNLWMADLIDTDLSGANLTGTDLSGANLDGTDLSGAILEGAIGL